MRKWRSENPAKSREAVKRYAETHPEWKREQTLRWQAANIERHRMIQRAANAVAQAISRGILTRASACEECGCENRRITAAHHDYSKPLEVRWLCGHCHIVWDKADPKTLRAPSVARRTGAWSVSHDRCIECETTDLPHWGRGFCRRCYMRAYMRQRSANRPLP
jgi:ribosomal protein S27AE